MKRAGTHDPLLPAEQPGAGEAPRPPSILIIAGEVSGDMHAARVVHALRRELPDAVLYGIGGEHLRNEGVEILFDAEQMAVMGFVEVLRKLHFFRKVFHEMVDVAFRSKPDAVVLVDYPGFNLRLAARMHAMGLKVIYYICPQVWAWNRSRIPRMARIVDKLITIFPFEAGHFDGTGLDVEFAGHPLVDEAGALREKPLAALPWDTQPGVALLPGSRRHEIQRMLPVMWQAAGILSHKQPDLEFIIAAPGQTEAKLINDIISSGSGGPPRHHVVTGQTRDVLRQARAAMVASGTATIETALVGCPMAIVYKMAPLTYLSARLLVRVDHIGMVNIVAGRRICPELIQGRATPRALAAAVEPLLGETEERARMVDALHRVADKLERDGDAAENAARMIVDTLRRPA